MAFSNLHRRFNDDRLIQNPSEVTMIPSEGEYFARGLLFSEAYTVVYPEPFHDLILGDGSFQLEGEIYAMHVLRVHF